MVTAHVAGNRIRCTQCQQKLLVPPGRERVTCPKCNASLSVRTKETKAVRKPPTKKWYVHTSGGDEFGPVDRSEIDQWVEEGRIEADDQLLRDGWDEWKWAQEVFPQHFDGEIEDEEDDNPFNFGESKGGYSSHSNYGGAVSSRGGGGGGGYQRPDRGSTILMLGIVSFVFNPVFIMSIVTIMMANADLAAMRRGDMNRAGEGNTKMGKMFAMISAGLGIAAIVIGLLVFMMLIAGGAAASNM